MMVTSEWEKMDQNDHGCGNASFVPKRRRRGNKCWNSVDNVNHEEGVVRRKWARPASVSRLMELILICFLLALLPTNVFAGLCGPGTTPQGDLCSPCSAGSFKSSTSNSTCTSCTSNSDSPAGSQASSDCYCVDGYSWYASSTICIPCPTDTWCTGGVSNACPINSASPAQSGPITACKCNVGFTGADGATCSICPAGSYKDTAGDTSCTPCAAGTYGIVAGATEVSFCFACPPASHSSAGSSALTSCECNAGYSGAAGGPCLVCQAGEYKAVMGSDACLECAAGTFSASIGATAAGTCMACPANSMTADTASVYAFQCQCEKGYTGAADSCTACGAGKYKDSLGEWGCAECPAGTFLATTGSTAAGDCASCPLNSHSPAGSTALTACVCNAGYTGNDGGSCAVCVAGTYKEGAGSAECQSCPAGTFSVSTGASVCATCPDPNHNSAVGSSAATDCKCNAGYSGAHGGTCSSCGAGSYWNLTVTEGNCIGCLVGKFHYEAALVGDQCFTCPAHTDTPSAASDALSDCVCNMGYTAESEGRACLGCAEGTYKETTGSSACTVCPANTYSATTGATSLAACSACDANAGSPTGSYGAALCTCNAGFTGPDGGSCSACMAGSYKPSKGPYSCKQCQAGKYSSATGATSEGSCLSCHANSDAPVGSAAAWSCTCNAGYYLSGSTCTACAVGSYKDAQGDGACSACPSHASTQATASVEHAQCVCDDGYYGSLGASCTACESGYYCAGGVKNTCPYYTVSSALSSAVADCTCQPGYYSLEVDGTGCQLCPRNSYCAGGVSITACPVENPSSGFGSSSSYDCGPSGGGGGSCESGTFDDGSSCVECPANSYCAGDADPPVSCGSNSGSVAGMPSSAACTCNAGYYGVPGAACVSCEADSYCKWSIKNACPLNSASAALSTVVTNCACPGGYRGAAGAACTPCQAGTWCSSGTSTDCAANSASAYLSSVVTSCTCDEGFTGSDGAACAACAAGSYKATSGSSVCSLCPVGTWSWLAEAVDDATCVTCPLNSDSAAGSSLITHCQCNAGYYGSDGGPCKACPAGTWKGTQGSADCTQCDAGTFSSDVGATAMATCQACPARSHSAAGAKALSACTCNAGSTGSDGSACTQCAAGTYKDSQGSMGCAKCPEDTYSTGIEQTSITTCLSCGVNSTSPKGSGASTDCVCKKGHTGSDGGSCSSCPAGFYKAATGSAACVQCSAGKYSYDASSKCSVCPQNSYSEAGGAGLSACKCNAGYTGSDGGPCTICSAGTWKGNVGSAACTSCAAGTWAYSTATGATSMDVCKSCPVASHSGAQSVGFTSCTCNLGHTGKDGSPCISCPGGSYKPTTGSAKCTGCSAGTYSPATSATSSTTCQACPTDANSYYHSDDIIDCRCVAGHTGPDGGACPSCVAGTWKSWTGSQDCKLCKAGQYSEIVGAQASSVCLTCPANTYSDAGAGSINRCTANRGYYMSGSSPNFTSPTYATPTLCPIGTYKGSMLNNSWCTYCYSHSTTPSEGSISISQCLCVEGYTVSATNACALCVAGKYKNSVGFASCVACAISKYSATSRTQCLDCPAQATTTSTGQDEITDCVCNKGYTGADGDTCTICGAGTYKSTLGSATCSPCPAGTYSGSAGLTAESQCTNCPANYWSNAGSTAVGNCDFEILFTTAEVGQSQPLAGGSNTLTVTLTANLDTPASKSSGITISGLAGAVAGSSVAISAVSGGNSANVLFGSVAGWSSNSLILTIASGQTMTIGTTYIFSFVVQNPSAAQDMPPSISIKANGRISTAIRATDTGAATSIRGVASASLPLKIFVPRFNVHTIHQSSPLASVLNTITVTIQPNCDIAVSSRITVSGLTDCLTRDTSNLAVSSTGSTLDASGTWSATPGSLVMTVATTLSGGTNYTVSFTLQNPVADKNAVSPTVLGKVETGVNDAPIQESVLDAQIYSILGVPSGSAPLTITVPRWETAKIGQSYPVANADTLITVTLKCNTDMPINSYVTITGLTGSQRQDSTGLGGSDDLILYADVGFSAFYNRPVWNKATGTLTFQAKNDLPMSTQTYVIWFTLKNRAIAQVSPSVSMSGHIEAGSLDSPITQAALVKPNSTIFGVLGGGNPLYSIVPTFGTRVVAQSNPLAFATENNVTVTLQSNIDLSQSQSSVVTLSGLVNLTTTSSSVFLHDFTIGPNASTAIFSGSGNPGYGTFSSGSLILALETGKTLRAGVAYSFRVVFTNPSGIQPALNVSVAATGTAPFLSILMTSPSTPVLGMVGWGFPGKIVCPSGYYAPAGSNTVTCTACPAGYYSAAIGTMDYSTCTRCPANTHSEPASTVVSYCTCNKGYTGTGAYDCASCPKGKYKDTTGSAACTSCPAGKYSTTVTSTASSDCLSCPSNTNSPASSDQLTDCICDIGYYGPNGVTCQECPVGTYKIVNGPSSCIKCEAAKYSGATAAVSESTCQSCPAGTNSPEGSNLITDCTCLVGYTATDNGVVCTTCEPGYYKPTRGPDACSACVPGKYSETIAAFDIATCLGCPVNTYAPTGSGSKSSCTCNAGYFGEDGTACVACPRGQYKSLTGSGDCALCPAGKYSTELAAVSISYCQSCGVNANSPAGSSSVQACACTAGYYIVGSICSSCQEGFWCAGGQKQACSANSNSPPLSPLQANCTCNAGYSPASVNGACQACAINTYKGSTDNATCSACPENSVSDRTGSNSLQLCTCKPGYYGPLGGPCSMCEAGSWCSRSVRTSCPSHTSSSAGKSAITDCHALPGFTCASGKTCALCPVDNYCPGGPVPNVFPCPDGKTALQGMSNVVQCADASVDCADINAVKVFGLDCSCRGGFYGDAAASEICKLCPEGFYCPGGNVAHRCGGFSTSVNGSTFSAGCVCFDGYYRFESVCKICPADRWCYSGIANTCPYNTASRAGATRQSDCVPLEGYCAAPGYTYLPGAQGTYCDAGVMQECPPPRTQSPPMSTSVDNCTSPDGVNEMPTNTTNNTDGNRVIGVSCGSGPCNTGFYRGPCSGGGECMPCTTPPLVKAKYSSSGVPYDQDACAWECDVGYEHVGGKPGECQRKSDSKGTTDINVVLGIDGALEDFESRRTIISAAMASAAGVSQDRVISLSASMDSNEQPEPAPTETPLPKGGEEVMSPVIIAAIVAGGAGVILGGSAGMWSLQRGRKLKKIASTGGSTASAAPTGLTIGNQDDFSDMPTTRNAWSDENNQDEFGRYKKPQVKQNPFLTSDGFVNPQQKYRNDIYMDDYETFD